MKLNFVCIFFLVILQSCAYRLSNNVDKLPNDVKVIYIPLFANDSKEPNVEVMFTNALKAEALRFGKLNMVNSESAADATLSGSITSVELASDESVIEAKDAKYLPYGTVLPTQVRVTVTVSMKMTEIKTKKILWSSEYKQYRNYTPPQITLPGLNSANNLYNLSERRQTLETLAKDMMQLAFDRLVDNF